MTKRFSVEDSDGESAIREIAQVFAQGVLRLHRLGQLPLGPNGLSLETALEAEREYLAIPRNPPLSVTRG